MSVFFLLDGYNILKSDETGLMEKGSLEDRRNTLISCIKTARPQGSEKNRIAVVFDGKAEGYYSPGSFNKKIISGIEVIFSEGDSADTVIEKIVVEDKNPARIVVVTDDKGIRKLLGCTGCRFMGTLEFVKKLFKKDINKNKEQKTSEKDLISLNEELAKIWLK